MSQYPSFENPYSQPMQPSTPTPPPSGGSTTKNMLPAVALMVVGGLGLLASLFSFGLALFGPEVRVDPTAPEWLQEFQKGSRGTLAAGMQAFFILLNVFILVGGFCLMKLKNWGVAFGSTLAAMINFGNCCCILGIPVGIWAMVVVLQPDVKAIFKANQ